MFYDVPYRHQQAVEPAALATIVITLQAMTKALDDCRNAGVDPNTDPAMVLLARHMATVSTNRAPRSVLRHACDKRLQSLKRYPALLAFDHHARQVVAVGRGETDAEAQDRAREALAWLDAPAGPIFEGPLCPDLTASDGEAYEARCRRCYQEFAP